MVEKNSQRSKFIANKAVVRLEDICEITTVETYYAGWGRELLVKMLTRAHQRVLSDEAIGAAATCRKDGCDKAWKLANEPVMSKQKKYSQCGQDLEGIFRS